MPETVIRLLVSVTTQSENDIPDAIEQARDRLEPDGLTVLEGADEAGNVFYNSSEG